MPPLRSTYSCRSKYCYASFDSERSLNLHRNTCAHYKRHEAAALEKRKERRKEESLVIKAKKKEVLERAREKLLENVSQS
jgi:hypothetical protein